MVKNLVGLNCSVNLVISGVRKVIIRMVMNVFMKEDVNVVVSVLLGWFFCVIGNLLKVVVID